MILQRCYRPCSSKRASAAVRCRQPALVCTSQLGLLYTSCSGSTRNAAQSIHRSIGGVCSPPIDLQQGLSSGLEQYDGYIVGAPTYNTNASCQRSGTAWDDLLYNGTLQELQVKGKPFAVFGCGDAVRFKHNFADAVGELHDVLAAAGGIPLTSSYCCPSTYLMGYSKAIRAADQQNGSTSLFVGLPLDYANQPKLSAARISSWCHQLLHQLEQEHPAALLQVLPASLTQCKRQQQQQEQQQLAIGDWPAEWPRQGLFQGEYPKGFRLMDRWYQLGDRWYRFHDAGFQVRAGFREHAVYSYAYRDMLSVEVVQQDLSVSSYSGGSICSSSLVEQDVWVEVRQAAVGSSALLSSRLLVLKNIECWGASNTIAEFLRLQMRLHTGRHMAASAAAAAV